MNARLMSASRTSSTGTAVIPVLLRGVDIFRKGDAIGMAFRRRTFACLNVCEKHRLATK